MSEADSQSTSQVASQPTSQTGVSGSASRAWLIVWLLCVVACLNYLDRIMLTTMRESVKEAIPMTDAQFGLLTSVFLWVYGILSPIAGFLADRFSRTRIIIASLVVWSLTTWLTSHAVTFEQLLATRVIMGLSEAFYLPAALALITDYHRGSSRSLAVGIHNSGVCIGSGIAGIGGWLAERHSWSFAFSLFGIIGVVYSVILMLTLRDDPSAKETDSATAERMNFLSAFRILFKEKSYILLLMQWGLLGLASWGVIGWMPAYFQQQFDLGQGSAGLSTTAFLQIATVAGMLVGGALADRLSRSMEHSRIYVAVAGLLLAAPAILLTANTSLFWLAIIGLVFFGFGRAWSDVNTMPILCMVSDPRCRATGFGILNFFACIVGGVTIYVGGIMRDSDVNVRQLFGVSGVALLICAFLLWLIKPLKGDSGTSTK